MASDRRRIRRTTSWSEHPCCALASWQRALPVRCQSRDPCDAAARCADPSPVAGRVPGADRPPLDAPAPDFPAQAGFRVRSSHPIARRYGLAREWPGAHATDDEDPAAVDSLLGVRPVVNLLAAPRRVASRRAVPYRGYLRSWQHYPPERPDWPNPEVPEVCGRGNCANGPYHRVAPRPPADSMPLALIC